MLSIESVPELPAATVIAFAPVLDPLLKVAFALPSVPPSVIVPLPADKALFIVAMPLFTHKPPEKVLAVFSDTAPKPVVSTTRDRVLFVPWLTTPTKSMEKLFWFAVAGVVPDVPFPARVRMTFPRLLAVVTVPAALNPAEIFADT